MDSIIENVIDYNRNDNQVPVCLIMAISTNFDVISFDHLSICLFLCFFVSSYLYYT